MTRSELEIVVDLGNVTDRSTAPDPLPRRSAKRSIGLAFLVTTALLLLAAAGPLTRSTLTVVADAPVGSQAHVLLTGGRLFVDSYGEKNTITAYALDGGRRLWSTDDAEEPDLGALLAVDGTIVVSTSGIAPHETNTESFDQATGRRLWASESGYAVVTSHGVLLQSPPSAATFADGFVDSAGYQLLDPRTGQAIWSLHIPDGCVTALAETGVPTTLVEVCVTDSSVRAIDLADGRTVAERLVPLGQDVNVAPLDPSEVMERPQVTVIGATLLISRASVPTPTVDAYALDGLLSERWSGLTEPQAQYVEPCGDAICFYTTGQNGIRIDVTTGESLGPIAAPPVRVAPGSLAVVATNGIQPQAILNSPAGTDVAVQPDGNAPVWLERTPGELIAPLPGAGPTSCAQTAGYIVCATLDSRVRVWRLS